MTDADIQDGPGKTDATIKLTPAEAARALSLSDGLPVRIPVRLGSYAIEGLIGRGGMGVVYKARQDGLNRLVAVKVMSEGGNAPEPARRRFFREAKAMAKLRHPNIVSVYEVGECEGQPFFSMEYIDGARMDAVMRDRKIVSNAIIADFVARIADAIHYAHENGIVHRDLKPSNILVDSRANPIVTDFGLAKDMDAGSLQSMSGDVLGTPAFMSPEQAGGRVSEVGPRSDVYSLGAILYWLLTRHEPHEGLTVMDTLRSVLYEDPPMIRSFNPGVEADLCAICLKAMEKDPAARYQSAHDLAVDLRRFINGYVVEAEPWTWRRAARRFIRRNRRAVLAASLAFWAMALAAAIAALAFHRSYLDIAARQLASADAGVRAEAVSSLGREIAAPDLLQPEQAPRAIGLLMDLHRDADPAVRARLLEFLSEHGGLAPVADAVTGPVEAWLVSAAGDASEPASRSQAIKALGRIPRPEFTRVLVERLRDENPIVRLQVIRALGERGDFEAVSPLVSQMAGDYVCRPEIESALQRIYAKQRTVKKSGEARLADNAISRVTAALAKNLEQVDAIEKAAPREDRSPFAGFERALASGNPEERMRAAYELGLSGAPEAAPILFRALGDKDPAVGPAVAMALARLNTAGQETVLVEGLGSGDDAVRLNSALALGFGRKTDALDPLLVALANEKDVEVKRGMILALGELGLPGAAPEIRRASEVDPRIAPEAQAALRRLPAAAAP